MITTKPNDTQIDHILKYYDESSEAIKRDLATSYAFHSIAFQDMLEQHSHYDLGDGFTIAKSGGKWHIYYMGKHVDTYDRPDVHSQNLTSYRSIASAVDAASSLRLRAEWCQKT